MGGIWARPGPPWSRGPPFRELRRELASSSGPGRRQCPQVAVGHPPLRRSTGRPQDPASPHSGSRERAYLEQNIVVREEGEQERLLAALQVSRQRPVGQPTRSGSVTTATTRHGACTPNPAKPRTLVIRAPTTTSSVEVVMCRPARRWTSHRRSSAAARCNSAAHDQQLDAPRCGGSR